jgi:hypothetical protein
MYYSPNVFVNCKNHEDFCNDDYFMSLMQVVPDIDPFFDEIENLDIDIADLII